jgi:hypothetical protein
MDEIVFRVFVAGDLEDERRLDLSMDMERMAHEIGLIGGMHVAICGMADDEGLTYLVEVEFPDGEHVRWGTDPLGMVMPMATAFESVLAKMGLM